jgi:hypothetical protein
VTHEKFVGKLRSRDLHMIDGGGDPADRDVGGRGVISPAAQRALAEAEARRKDRADREAESPRELGRDGLDPTRYGDWEKGGIASDF